MVPGSRLFAAAAVLLLSSWSSPGLRAQSRMTTFSRFLPDSASDCRALFPLHLADPGARLTSDLGAVCPDSTLLRGDVAAPMSTKAPDLPPVRVSETPDAIPAELLSLGKRGRDVLVAREAVLSILQSDNACSAWFLAKDPDAVATFRSLHLVLDTEDLGLIRKLVKPYQNFTFVQPYVARAQQDVGPGSTIVINQRGAFFEDATGVLVVKEEIGPDLREGPRMLRVGSYRGATPQARVLTVLHEFGHIIDLLPLDGGIPAGPGISMHNTKLVEEHCKPELEASAKNKAIFQQSVAASLGTLSRH